MKFKYTTSNIIIDEYVNNKLSIEDICLKHRCCHSRVSKLLSINNIHIRSNNGGGIHNKFWKGTEHVSYSYFNNVKMKAKDRELSFNISIQYIEDLFVLQKGKCAYSKVELTIAHKPKIYTASLDRIDSSIGYEVGNVQWVHKVVNYMKQSLKEEEFINWCKLIAENHDKIYF